MNLQPTAEAPLLTIAIADDHIVLREGITSFLDSFSNCRVIIEADNGQLLLEQLDLQLPDLCILDISMPIMNGYDTLKAIRKKWPALKVMIFSMVDDQYAIIRMLKLGANGFLLKNCIYQEFQKALNIIANGGYYFPTVVTSKNDLAKLTANLPAISERQIEFLKLCASDLNYNQIANLMGTSIRAVESLQQRLSEKLHINSRIGLVLFAIKTGIVMLN